MTESSNRLLITATQDTFLKKSPAPADSLKPEQKVFVEKDGKWSIVWKSGLMKDGHIKVSLDHKAGNWYIYSPHWDGLASVPPAATPARSTEEVGLFRTDVRALNLSQPDARTCQSACIGMAVGDRDILGIRKKLDSLGEAGNPAVMGRVIKQYGVNYTFDDNASLSEVRAWLRAGEFLITHGWFTRSGHVICLDGIQTDPGTLSYRFDVKDPWSEFDGPSWSYNNPSLKFFDGFYSSHIIYAACVASVSSDHAKYLYSKKDLDSTRKGMWVHRIKP
ncbi:putative peptidoglycan-binding protein [Synechococcus phage S-CBWM1]|uniref:Putative peptidoglycan-binding protein n=1 Tax=Synechococcus phage S-CBWM1 TaxID=2053653 RepID=A0A3G1L3S8_9CAUD|nr:putative peptidoglycan-binding protein [Synechococcus phage S-CBWM1]ATW62844.1 putative peptidoglycan-binding protein [Synechococcus phage S-CBWM1]